MYAPNISERYKQGKHDSKSFLRKWTQYYLTAPRVDGANIALKLKLLEILLKCVLEIETWKKHQHIIVTTFLVMGQMNKKIRTLWLENEHFCTQVIYASWSDGKLGKFSWLKKQVNFEICKGKYIESKIKEAWWHYAFLSYFLLCFAVKLQFELIIYVSKLIMLITVHCEIGNPALLDTDSCLIKNKCSKLSP